MTVEIKLPEIGDGITSGDVLQVLVREGDLIEKDQDIVELETDKATTGVPSTHAGRVVKVHVREGDTVPVGGVLISLEPDEPTKTPEPAGAEEPPAQAKPAASAIEVTDRGDAETVDRPVLTGPKDSAEPETAPHGAPTPSFAPQAAAAGGETAPSRLVPAGPSIRRFARELGVDLHQVSGSGKGGRITREDVLEFVRQSHQAAEPSAGNVDKWGPIRIEQLSRIRRTIAAKMHESWSTVPRVTNFDDADITELEKFRQASKKDYADQGIKLTSLPFVIKAVSLALKAHPLLNASLDLDHDQVIYKEYVNIGVAVDTERGLVVPSLRDTDKLTIQEIARGLARIVEKVRHGDISLEDLRGSSFTVSNLGAVGGTYSTPIVNVPEVAILLCGRSRKVPTVREDNEIDVRLMMPLSLSYDHRLVDGAAAARFLNDVIDYLSAPSRLLLAP